MLAVAIIGTAGRDRGDHYTRALWNALYADALSRFDQSKKYKLVSGGAAWVDQLAVELFLDYPKTFTELQLYLPAPLNDKGEYEGERSSSGSISNWYHELFQEATGIDGRQRILDSVAKGARIEHEPKAAGMGSFFVRNTKVAEASDACLAYTWGTRKEPADGGTKDTWNKLGPDKRRVHIRMSDILGKVQSAKG